MLYREESKRPDKPHISKNMLEKFMLVDIKTLGNAGWSLGKLQLINFFLSSSSLSVDDQSHDSLHAIFTNVLDHEIERRLSSKSKR